MSQAPDSAVVASATTAAAATAAAAKDPKTQKALVSLEEDDEFEDFPVEDWDEKSLDPEIGAGSERLWDEKWDDDDADDDFAAQLKEELSKKNTS